MKNDTRPEEETEAQPEREGLMHRLGHATTVRELRMLDATIGLFQRWRNRIEPPAEEDDRRGGRRHGGEQAIPEPAPLSAAAAKHGHRRGILIVIALLLATGVGGMLFSYALLSKVIESDDLIIDDLRDQIAQMDKADARNVSIQARDQRQIAEYKKSIREYEVKIQDYEEQVAQLRQQMVALTPPPPPPRRDAVTSAGPRPLRSPRTTTPRKTGNCVANGSNAAADLSRCVESFNRP